jgi:hypothetical protein
LTTHHDQPHLADYLHEHPPPEPFTDDYSAAVIDEAVASLGTLRRLQWLGHGATQVHALESLRQQIDHHLSAAHQLAADQQED